jgi:type IV secretory pathway protease TraF
MTMGIDWRAVIAVALVVCVALACLTVMAVRGLVPAAIVASAATGAIGWFTGWLQKQPSKEGTS